MARVGSEPVAVPVRLANYPNPFNPSTMIEMVLPEGDRVVLDICSATGQTVRWLADGWHSPGMHRYEWDGSDGNGSAMAGGVYITRLMMPRGTVSRKLLLVK